MIDYSTGFSRALRPDVAAEELARGVELALGGPGRIGGGLLFATAASGRGGFEIGQLLLERWPEAALLGSSFEGVLAQGRAFRDEPAVGLLAWGHGPEEPIPLFFDPADLTAEHLEEGLRAGSGRSELTARDLLLLFPDALAAPGLESMLADFAPRLGHPSIAGAAASGLSGGPSLAWWGHEEHPAASLGLLAPGGAAVDGSPVRSATGSRFASPWLEISACRERWIDELEGEPPLDWIRRQLGLAPEAPVEPFLDRLLVRLWEGSPEHEVLDSEGGALDREEDRTAFVERYVVGLDDRRGSISVPGGFRRGGHLALALPDPTRAREALESAVAALAPSPLLMQFACRTRDEAFHGDPDLESALVAHHARNRTTFGTLAPFQLGPDAGGSCRMLVHSTVLAALGEP